MGIPVLPKDNCILNSKYDLNLLEICRQTLKIDKDSDKSLLIPRHAS